MNPLRAPQPSRCQRCGHIAAQVICSICKTPRPEYARILERSRRLDAAVFVAVVAAPFIVVALGG